MEVKRNKKLEYLAGLSFSDEEWEFYNENRHRLNTKSQARWDKAWRVAKERLVILEKIDDSNHAPQITALYEALKAVLTLPVVKKEFEYLDKGIGIKTPDGITLLQVRKALALVEKQ